MKYKKYVGSYYQYETIDFEANNTATRLKQEYHTTATHYPPP